MCLEVRNDYQKSSLLKVYLGWSKYGGGGGGVELFLVWGASNPSKKFRANQKREKFCFGLENETSQID